MQIYKTEESITLILYTEKVRKDNSVHWLNATGCKLLLSDTALESCQGFPRDVEMRC